jgi:hypothetical protein
MLIIKCFYFTIHPNFFFDLFLVNSSGDLGIVRVLLLFLTSMAAKFGKGFALNDETVFMLLSFSDLFDLSLDNNLSLFSVTIIGFTLSNSESLQCIFTCRIIFSILFVLFSLYKKIIYLFPHIY